MSMDPLAEREEETTVRLSLDLPASAVEFLERFAAYRNALNELQKRPMKKWTRKSAAETYVVAQVEAVRESMAEAFAEFGDFPADDKQMLAYAKAVLASVERISPKKK